MLQTILSDFNVPTGFKPCMEDLWYDKHDYYPLNYKLEHNAFILKTNLEEKQPNTDPSEHRNVAELALGLTCLHHIPFIIFFVGVGV